MRRILPLLLSTCVAGLLVAPVVRAQVSNGMAASGVLGPSDLVTRPASATTASRFNGPNGVVLDPATGKLFVADRANNRVLRWASSDAMSNGSSAEAVLGQPDFTTASSGLTASKMNNPIGVFVDAAGRLWVGDYGNNRVLRFDNAATKASGSAADGVLGQPDFVTGTAVTSAVKMSGPCGLWVDAAGRLWVSNFGNHRVLRFDDAANKANGAAADGVLGQLDFVTGTSGVTQAKLNNPNAVCIDAAGRLWVSDYTNKRVVRFDNAAAKANGANADGVLGQPDFVTNSVGTTQAKFNTTRFVFVDSNGRLYVVEEANNRVMVFENAAALANGANADYVIGQSSFTTATAPNPPNASSLATPRAVFVDEPNGRLWLADWANQRVLRYAIAVPVGTTLALTGPNGGESWATGSVHAISWNSSNVSAVNLDWSSDNGTTWSSIATNVAAAAQSYAWTVPSTPTTQALVRITDAADPLLTDASNAAFTIFTPVATVTLVSPNGLQQWAAGSQHKILFTSSYVTNVRLEASADDGATWSDIVASAPAASGEYLWNVPSSTGATYRVRVSNAANSLVADASDQAFAVVAPLVGHEFDALFFSDSPTSGYYDASYTSVTAPSTLERANTDKCPVSPAFSLVGNYALRLSWTSNTGGDWAMANAGVGWPGQDITTRDSLVFNIYSENAVAAASLPCIYLEDLSNRKSAKLPLSGLMGDVPAGSWQRIAIPVQAFRSNPGTADFTSIKTLFLGQQAADGAAHVWYVDDVRMTGGRPVTGDSARVVVVIGSSTAAGTGASTADSAWVGRYRAYVKSLDPNAFVVNLAVGGYTTYNVMPTGYVPPSGRPAPSPLNNITRALAYRPWAILVNLPSNDATNGYTNAEQLANYDTLRARAAGAGVPIWISTTQPRNLSTQTQRDQLRFMADSIMARYSPYAVNLYADLAAADGTILAQYGYGDGIHLNDAGHALVYQKFVGAGVWQQINPTVGVTRPNGGDVLLVGTPDTLRWSAGNVGHVAAFDLELSRTGAGGPWTTLATVGPAVRSLVWTVTGPEAPATCWFRVTARAAFGPLVADLGDGPFSIVDFATPARVSEFAAVTAGDGVQVRWRLVDAGDVASVRVQRSASSDGPWVDVPGAARIEGDATVLVDRDAPSGALWYRLVLTTTAGAELRVDAIEASRTDVVTAFALGRIAPNPATGPVTVAFALPVAAQVEVSVLDVQGRVVAHLADGAFAAGRHSVPWAPRSSRAPGVYFARMRTAGHEFTRRFTVVE